MVHHLWGCPGQIKSDWVMKNFIPKTTGHEYFKKQNDRVLKKKSFNDNNKTLRHFKVLILLDILVLQLPRVTPRKRNFMVSVCHQNEACTIEM